MYIEDKKHTDHANSREGRGWGSRKRTQTPGGMKATSRSSIDCLLVSKYGKKRDTVWSPQDTSLRSGDGKEKELTYIMDTDGDVYCPAGIKDSIWVSTGFVSQCRYVQCTLARRARGSIGYTGGSRRPKEGMQECQVSCTCSRKAQNGRGKDSREGETGSRGDRHTFSVNRELREPSCDSRLRPRAPRGGGMGSANGFTGVCGGLSVEPPPFRLAPHGGASSG